MTSRMLVSLRVAATPARAFEVFTEEIGAWWRPNPLFAFTLAQRRGDPGALSFEPGAEGRLILTHGDGEVFEIGRVLDWSPPERLAFSWRQASFAPDQMTRVEARFEAADGGETRVTIEHLGWDCIPADHRARHGFADAIFLRRHAEWWRRLLMSLARWTLEEEREIRAPRSGLGSSRERP